MDEATARRFWAKVDKRGPDECWPWTGATARGYGKFRVRDKTLGAHRFAYELLIGAIPDGLQLDHVKARGCTRRDCVNPAHLEPVTQQENIRRGEGGEFRRNLTHCHQGHPFDEANTYRYRGRRHCRTCQRRRDSDFQRRRRSE